ncbi:cytochrome P450 [Rhodobacteraceae bacterium nBUS_22]
MFDLSRIPDGFFENPYPFYKDLLEGPSVLPQNDGSVIVSKHALLNLIYKDVNTFVSDKKLAFGPKFGVGSALFEHHTTSLVFNDPPLHTRVRKIMTAALNPRAIQGMKEGLEATVIALLDELELKSAKTQEVDLIDDYASKIPIQIIGNLLAIPMEEREPLRDWSLAILGALEPNLTTSQLEKGNAAVCEFKNYLKGLVSRRKKAPKDLETDVLTRLIQAQDNQELSETELLQNCIFILNAGHETTTNLIGSALHMLWSNPKQKVLLVAHPNLIDTAVEEVLRTQSPNQFGNRQTSKQIELDGVLLDKDTLIHLCIGAANRDPDVFPKPDEFDIQRTNAKRHLGFSAGPHTCVGLTLARLEAKIALESFLRRFPNYTLFEGAEISPRIRFRGFLNLPATLDPT